MSGPWLCGRLVVNNLVYDLILYESQLLINTFGQLLNIFVL